MPTLNDQKTELLFWKDPYLKKFDAEIIEIIENDIILNKTAFYPVGGGQISDKGIIFPTEDKENILHVTQVEKQSGKIIHKIKEKPHKLKVGDKIIGAIDSEYRLKIMKAHTSQHLLSAMILKHTKIATKKAVIEDDKVTIYLEKKLSFEKLPLILSDTNKLIKSGINVETKIYRKKKIPIEIKEKLRGILKEKESKVRIVQIGDIDYSLCGGTHISNTSEINIISLIDFKEDYLSYIFDDKAFEEIARLEAASIKLAKELSVKKEDVEKRITNLIGESNELKDANLAMGKEIANLKIENAKQNALNIGNYQLIFCYLPFVEKRFALKALGQISSGSIALILIKRSILLVISTSKELTANKIVKVLNNKIGSKGGGSEKIAQLSIAGLEKDIDSIVKIVEKIMKEEKAN